MKLGIITYIGRLGEVNYGQILQCYALQEYLTQQGHEVKVVKYVDELERKHMFKNSRNGKARKLFYELNILRKTLMYDESRIYYTKFKVHRFIQKYIKLTNPCYNSKQINNELKNVNGLVCGSDAIWHITTVYDPIYCLDFFHNDSCICISYAPSICLYSIPEVYKEMFENLLVSINKLDRISVRGNRDKKLIAERVDKVVQVVLDPTLLLQKEDYKKIMKPRKINKSYILVYGIGDISLYNNDILKLQEQKRIEEVVNIDFYQTKKLIGKSIKNVGIEDFLSLIYYSDMIVTDSFHGTVFSILFQKDFYLVKREIEKSKSNFSKIEDLLEQFNIENRVLGNGQKIIEEIDYSNVSKKLEIEREKSRKFLTIFKEYSHYEVGK